MNRFVFLSLFTATIALPNSSANADWQYSRWGMTPDQMLTASKGQLKRCDPKACAGQTTDKTAAQLFGPYQSGEFSFKSFAFFDKQTNKLAQVTLQLTTPEKANELIGALRARYGEPSSQNKTTIMTLLVWREQKDQIALMILGFGQTTNSASIIYQPRITEATKGL